MAVPYTTCLAAEPTIPDIQTFYSENLGLISRYVYSKVGNREEAEDLTSQIFLKAVRGLKMSLTEGNIRALQSRALKRAADLEQRAG